LCVLGDRSLPPSAEAEALSLSRRGLCLCVAVSQKRSQLVGVWNPDFNPAAVSFEGNPNWRSFVVEVSVQGCSGKATGAEVSFDIKAVVVGEFVSPVVLPCVLQPLGVLPIFYRARARAALNDTAFGGECNTHLDCIRTDDHGPAPKSNRVGMSANGNSDRCVAYRGSRSLPDLA
jgi:hypothetical protein